MSRLGLQGTITLESALFAAAESPADSDAALGIIRELQRQNTAGVDLGVSKYWSEQLRDLDTTSWNATVADVVSRATPTVVSALLSSNSPLPVPSFDEFAALSYLATFALESNAGFRSLYRQATKLGIKALGNLLNLGKIAFAPDTPAVRLLVAHLNASHAFFGDHLAGVWPTEAAAVAELNKGGKGGLWAIVAMRDGFDVPHRARYAIRMRFTTVPGTRTAVKLYSRVNDDYLRYYTSGFLTVQHAVDNALLRMSAGVAPGDVTTLVGAEGGAAMSAPALLMKAPPVPWGVPFPQPALSQNSFYEALGPLLGRP